jgi:hypothetical protein
MLINAAWVVGRSRSNCIGEVPIGVLLVWLFLRAELYATLIRGPNMLWNDLLLIILKTLINKGMVLWVLALFFNLLHFLDIDWVLRKVVRWELKGCGAAIQGDRIAIGIKDRRVLLHGRWSFLNNDLSPAFPILGFSREIVLRCLWASVDGLRYPIWSAARVGWITALWHGPSQKAPV